MNRNNLLFIILALFSLLLLASCSGKGSISVHGLGSSGLSALNAELTAIEIQNNQLHLSGSGLNAVSIVQITNNDGFSETFSIESSSSDSLIANGQQAISFTLGTLYTLALSNAFGAATYSITFTLQDGALSTDHFSDMGAGSGQILRYNGTSWEPSDLSGLTYAGNWDATNNLPNLDALSPTSSIYYIVNVAGTYGLTYSTETTWAVGDWAVWNDIDDQWEKVDNATYMLSFNGRSGSVTPAIGDNFWCQQQIPKLCVIQCLSA